MHQLFLAWPRRFIAIFTVLVVLFSILAIANLSLLYSNAQLLLASDTPLANIPYWNKVIVYLSNPEFINSEGYSQSPDQTLLGIAKHIALPLSAYLFTKVDKSLVKPVAHGLSHQLVNRNLLSFSSIGFVIGILLYAVTSLSRTLQSFTSTFLSFGIVLAIALFASIKSPPLRYLYFLLIIFFNTLAFVSTLQTRFWDSW